MKKNPLITLIKLPYKLIWLALGILSLILFCISIFVNFGVYRASLEFKSNQITINGSNNTIEYPFQNKSLLERSFLDSSPGGWASFSANNRFLTKRQSIDELSDKSCGEFFISPKSLYWTECLDGYESAHKNQIIYRLERPLNPRWKVSGICLFALLVFWSLLRFNPDKNTAFDLIYSLYFVVLFSTLFISSLSAPGGSYMNTIGNGAQMWLDHDPAGWYLSSANELGRMPPVFPGHPGIPLQIMLWLIQKIVSVFSEPEFDFPQAVAVNFFYVQVLSKTACTVIYITASLVLAKIGHVLFESKKIGMYASLFFSSSFFVIYFSNRISPDGLGLLFFLLSFLFAAYVFKDAKNPNCLRYIFLSCFFSVLAFFTKMTIMFLLPLYLSFLFLFQDTKNLTRNIFIKRILAISAGLTLGYSLMAPFMDWVAYYDLWTKIISIKVPNDLSPDSYWLKPLVEFGKYMLKIINNFSITPILPLLELSHLAFTFGSTSICLFFIVFFWERVRKNVPFLKLCLYGALTLIIFSYRDFAFHYFQIFFAIACLSVAFFLDKVLVLNFLAKDTRNYIPVLLMIFFLNLNGILIAIDSHRQRELASVTGLPIYLALTRLSPGEHLQTINTKKASVEEVGLLTENLWNVGAPSRLIDAITLISK